MHRLALAALLVGSVGSSPGCGPGASAPAGTAAMASALDTDDEKTVYALGLVIGDSIRQFDLTGEEIAIVQQGLGDSLAKRPPKVALQEFGPRIKAFESARVDKEFNAERARALPALEAAAAEPGAVKTASGLVFQSLADGSGKGPTAMSSVRVKYRGTLVDGTEFDASQKPVEFPLSGVIPCWTEGLQKMKAGGKARLTCPTELAYGRRGSPPKIKPGAALVFEVELVDVL